MPKCALANDNWIGRMPFPFTPLGEPLHDMEWKSLARARMCVNKIIAEPEKPGPREAKQGGLRGNSIVFPQAKVELCRGLEYPPIDDPASYMLLTQLHIPHCDGLVWRPCDLLRRWTQTNPSKNCCGYPPYFLSLQHC